MAERSEYSDFQTLCYAASLGKCLLDAREVRQVAVLFRILHYPFRLRQKWYFVIQRQSLSWLPEMLTRSLESCLASKGLCPMINLEWLHWAQEGCMHQTFAIPGLKHLNLWKKKKCKFYLWGYIFSDSWLSMLRRELIYLESRTLVGAEDR